MKLTKKILSMLLTLALLAVMAVPAFAAVNNGSIIIKNAMADNTYTAYRILDLESFNADTNKYSYKASEKWAAFVGSAAIKDVYLRTDEAGYVTWVEGAEVTDFADLAIEYAEKNEIASDASAKATTTTVEFTGLPLGYYLLDTSLGSLCSLDTTNPSVEMSENNEKPEIDKKVYNKVDETYADANSAKIGEDVQFRIVVTAQKGAHDYIVHDAMSEGLTFNNDIKVVVGDKELTKNTDYTVTTGHTNIDGHPNNVPCTFHVEFSEEFLEGIEDTVEIYITYTATLNKDAVVYEDTNFNNVKLEYGDDISTEWEFTDTYTFHMDIAKTDKDNVILSKAVFELYTQETGGEPIKLIDLGKDTEGRNKYRVAEKDEAGSVTEFNAEIASIIGLGRGTYYLEEVSAPEGYNKLTERQEVELEKTNLHVVLAHGKYYSGGVKVVNQSGTELPSTGGMGTTLFYLGGGAMFLGALVLLVTKKRMKD